MSQSDKPSFDRWRRDLELAEHCAGVGVWNIDLATGLAHGRPQFFRLMGLAPTAEAVPMATIRALRHPDDRQRVLEGFRKALEDGCDTYEIEYRIIRPDGQTRWIFGRGRVVRNGKGEPIQYSGVDIDITERKAVEAALAQSEERYRLLVDHANDIVAMLDLNFTFTSINPAVERVLGYTPDEIMGQPLARYAPHKDVQLDTLKRRLSGAASTQCEMQLLGKNGEPFTLEVNSKLIFGADGSPIAIHSIARDVSERKDAEARQAVLLKELQHRTKNMLAVIQSIASNTLNRSSDLEAAHTALLGRLHALAHAQELVASGAAVGTPLRDLIAAQLMPFGARAHLSGDAVMVGSGFAQAFALIVHELATNAAKYGSLSSSTGSVDITWAVENGEEPKLMFSWRERDGPKVEQETRREGFGTRLISMIGTPSLSFDEDGFRYALRVGLGDVAR